VNPEVKLAGQLQDSFLELLLLLLLGAEIPLQVGKAGGLGLSPDEDGVELMRAGLLLVGEMQERQLSLAACLGDDDVFLISPSS